MREADEPRIEVVQVSCTRGEGDWRMVWRVANWTGSEMRLRDARFPHGRFRSRLMELTDVRIAPGGAAELEARVVCNGGGGDVENAFLITTVEWRNVRWRLLARMTVRFAADGSPAAATERVTVQRVGFAGPGYRENAASVQRA